MSSTITLTNTTVAEVTTPIINNIVIFSEDDDLFIKLDDDTIVNLSLTVAGVDTEIQFNKNGDFGSDSLFTYDDTSKTLTIGNLSSDGNLSGNANCNFGFAGNVDIQGTTGAFIVPRLTTTERDALSGINGMLVYNTTLNKFQGYENGAWTSLI